MLVQLEEESNTAVSKYQIKASGVGNMVPLPTPNNFKLEVLSNVFPQKRPNFIIVDSYLANVFFPFQAVFFFNYIFLDCKHTSQEL